MTRIARLNSSPIPRPSGEFMSAVWHMAHWASTGVAVKRTGRTTARTTSSRRMSGDVHALRGLGARFGGGRARGLLHVPGLGRDERVQDERGDEDPERDHPGEVRPLEAEVHEV